MNCNRNKTWLRISGFCGALACVLALFGFGLPAVADEGAPATRAVRLSSVDGQVQLTHGDQLLTDNAVANTPLFEGTRLVTGSDGRAEVQFEDGSVARISPDSSLTLSTLRPGGETELQLNSGLGYFELQGSDTAKAIRVKFGDNVATGSGFTVLRIRLDEPPGEVAVFSGNAHLEGARDFVLDLHGGQSVKLNSADPNNSAVANSIEPDSWDAWNSDRDQALTAAEAAATPATHSLDNGNNPAWGDLNQSGSWYNVPDQGYVWSPYEASNSDWDPYGTGYWMQDPSYGYIWVSGEPWGYMPYQCGAWNYYNSFGWGWAPGGCRPWWGGAWGVNIGSAPGWYHRPNRPVRPPHPVNPRPLGGVRVTQFAPVITVHRHAPVEAAMLPRRDGDSAVAIGGNMVQPLRPLPNRPHYDHLPVTSNRPFSAIPRNNGTVRPGYVRTPEPGGFHNGNWPGDHRGSQASPSNTPHPLPPNASRPSPGWRGEGRTAPAPVQRSAPPPQRSAPPSAPAPHAAPSAPPAAPSGHR